MGQEKDTARDGDRNRQNFYCVSDNLEVVEGKNQKADIISSG